jgi:hypothetical protein
MAAISAAAAFGLTRFSWLGLVDWLSRWCPDKVSRLATIVELASGRTINMDHEFGCYSSRATPRGIMSY